MKTALYTIKNLTNLHVGSGEINFDIIDNQVQRDEYNAPVIRSSSLKGALREHLSPPVNIDEGAGQVKYIFGPDNGDSSSSQQTGAYSFFDALLLSRPVRSNVRPYYNATSPEMIANLVNTIDDFGIILPDLIYNTLEQLRDMTVVRSRVTVFAAVDRDSTVEGLRAESVNSVDVAPLKELLGEHIALMHHEVLNSLALPVLARNQLENGESKNLWYEEVVPKRSKFYFVLGKPDNIYPQDAERITKADNRFDQALTEIVQIGANASVGYGYCKIEKVSS